MAASLLTADTSVVLPALWQEHPRHERARSTLAGRIRRLPGHVLLETTSALTRLPHGRAVPAAQAVATLEVAFPGEPWAPSEHHYRELMQSIRSGHVLGRAVFDALIAVVARDAGARLLTADRRAERTYRAIGVDYELLL